MDYTNYRQLTTTEADKIYKQQLKSARFYITLINMAGSTIFTFIFSISLTVFITAGIFKEISFTTIALTVILILLIFLEIFLAKKKRGLKEKAEKTSVYDLINKYKIYDVVIQNIERVEHYIKKGSEDCSYYRVTVNQPRIETDPLTFNCGWGSGHNLKINDNISIEIHDGHINILA